MLIRSTSMHSLLIAAILLTSYVAPVAPLSRHDVAIAGGRNATLVAWTEVDDSAARIHVSPLEHWNDALLPLTGQQQIAPAIAFDGTNFLVVWQEFDLQRGTTYAMRVTPVGSPLDAKPIRIGAATNAFPPRVSFSSGLYRIANGPDVVAMNSAGVLVPLFVPAPASTVDVAVTGDTTVFARAIPGFCSGFSMFTCTPAKNLLTYNPGGDFTIATKPLWIEAEGGAVLWSDSNGLNVTRNNATHPLFVAAGNAAIAGPLVVFEKEGRLFVVNTDTNAMTPVPDEGAISPALLARGDGRITLLYRTTSRPAQLKTMEIGAQPPPARRRTF